MNAIGEGCRCILASIAQNCDRYQALSADRKITICNLNLNKNLFDKRDTLG